MSRFESFSHIAPRKSDAMSDAPEIDRSHSRRMQAAIKKGNDERDCGESITYTSKALNDITESALNGMRSDKPITPDVLP